MYKRNSGKRGAGYFLPRALGVSPSLSLPQEWGIQGVERLSARSENLKKGNTAKPKEGSENGLPTNPGTGSLKERV
jgi:hypothetical protein